MIIINLVIKIFLLIIIMGNILILMVVTNNFNKTQIFSLIHKCKKCIINIRININTNRLTILLKIILIKWISLNFKIISSMEFKNKQKNKMNKKLIIIKVVLLISITVLCQMKNILKNLKIINLNLILPH
jgi:hypothetical protein